MGQYREKIATVTTTEWVRCSRIVLDNPLPGKGVPHITFVEETVRDDGTTVTTTSRATPFDPGAIERPFDPAYSFNLINLDNLNIKDKIVTFEDAFQILYSAYLHLAQQRDAVE